MEMDECQAIYFVCEVFAWRKSQLGMEHLLYIFIHSQLSFPVNVVKCIP